MVMRTSTKLCSPVCLLLLVFGPAASCGDDSDDGAGGTAAAGAGATTATSSPSWSQSSSTTTGGLPDAGCVPAVEPEWVPEGWEHYPDWSCDCYFYVPSSPDAFPPPIAWEPCPVVPDGLGCRVMVADWTDSIAAVALNPVVDKNPDGSAVVGFRRIMTDAEHPRILELVADADGPVRAALLNVRSPSDTSSQVGCSSAIRGVRQGMWLVRTQGRRAWGNADSSGLQGALGGSYDAPRPSLLQRYETWTWLSYHWAAGGKRYLSAREASLITSYSWGGGVEQFVASGSTDPEGGDYGDFVTWDDALFWSTSTLHRSGVNVWTPDGGAKPFIRWVGDATRGAGNFGTDGTDMVWSYGEGKEPAEKIYPTRSIMTAPYTTDPSALEPRRVRAQLATTTSIGLHPFQVGCGYAAHGGGKDTVPLVVRLSDGWAWPIPTLDPGLLLYAPIGVTCDEVFAFGEIGGRLNIVRIRLDSLGEGSPPD